MKNKNNRFIASAGVLLATGMAASAQTDITQVTSTVSGYVTAATTVGIAVLLFVLGRKVIRKLI